MNKPAQIRKLQLLLNDNCRAGAELLDEAKRLVEEAGMTVSGEGIATLSVRMADDDFEKLFAATTADRQLAIPDRLKPFVSSISEAPDHLRF